MAIGSKIGRMLNSIGLYHAKIIICTLGACVPNLIDYLNMYMLLHYSHCV